MDALDNGDMDALVTKFTSAPTANLSLKIFAKRDVGVGANQIPDISFFSGIMELLLSQDVCNYKWEQLPVSGRKHSLPLSLMPAWVLYSVLSM